MSGAWIQTFGGGKFDILDPKVQDVDPVMLAHSLAKLCRFTGHSKQFYSVASHSLLVADLVAGLGREDLRPHALLHDAHEAVIGDWSTPLKRALVLTFPGADDVLTCIEAPIKAVIHEAFGLDWPYADADRALIKQADWLALAAEKRDLLHPGPDWTAWKLPEAPVLKAIALEWPLAVHEFWRAMIREVAAGRMRMPNWPKVANDNPAPTAVGPGAAAMAVERAQEKEPAPLVGGRREEN